MSKPGVTARQLAVEALVRIEGGAFANLALPSLLERSGLEARDRAFVTELVYGTTRMRRACDWLVDRYLLSDPPDDAVRVALRMGAYQLQFMETPAHAAVGETVAAVPKRARGLVNAVLRRVADAGRVGEGDWPSDAIWLSYPDWIVERLTVELGRTLALTCLASMNVPVEVGDRGDGYGQDRASTWVAQAVAARPGERVLDLCAAPGGKATLLAQEADTIAVELVASRARKLGRNIEQLGLQLPVVIADGSATPFEGETFDRVLVDAPCSGLGALRRRPDARWNIEESAIERLAQVQRDLVAEAFRLLRRGGVLVYSVCTLTAAESIDQAGWARQTYPSLMPADVPGNPWRPYGTGAMLLPHDAGTDGMALFRWRKAG